jgi:Cu+-exporting ATPase
MDKIKTDPVCGMLVETNNAAGTAEYKGQTYYFCSDQCKTAFQQNPEKYTANPEFVNR